MHEPKNDVIYLRVETSVKQKFREVAARYPGDPSAVLRWLIVAFIDGRVTVADPTHKE
jgi:antitoxin component of RelBE/YafQ-DinJ toxin-antitoxin module